MSRLQSVLAPPYSGFWSLYGTHAWDDQHGSPSVPETREAIVDTLRDGRRGPDECVLDAGCGTGNFAVALARAVFHMIGIDCAPGKLAKARARVSWQLVGLLSFQRADLNLPLLFAAGEFDHVISINALRVAHTQPQHFENSIEC